MRSRLSASTRARARRGPGSTDQGTVVSARRLAPAQDRRLGAPVDADGDDVSVVDDRSPCHGDGAGGCHIQDLGAPRGTAECGYTGDDVPALVEGASSSNVCLLSRHATRAPTTRAITLARP